MKERYRLCSEVEKRIKKNTLRCESKDLAIFAKESQMTYGSFMNALYQRGIEVILTNKLKPVKEKPPKKVATVPHAVREKMRQTKIDSLPYVIAVKECRSGKVINTFPTVVEAANALGLSRGTVQKAAAGHNVGKRIEFFRKYSIEKQPKRKEGQ